MPNRKSYGFKRLPRFATLNMGAKFSEIVPDISLPSSVGLAKPEWISPCYDQLQTSSCVFNMWASLVEYGQRRSGGPTWTPSRLFAYANGRIIEGDLGVDGGSYCHDAFHQMAYVGVIPESEYPFTDDEDIVLAMPPNRLFIEAKNNQPKIFAPINSYDLNAMKKCLAHGFPFGGGFDVPKIFEEESFSKNPIVSLANFSYTGDGHGVAGFGYDDNISTPDGNGAFIFRNSWGHDDWGIMAAGSTTKGLFYMSYQFAMSKHFSDVWMTRFPNQATSLT